MQRKIIAILIVVVFIGLFFCPKIVLAVEELSLIPKKAQVVIIINNDPEDEGLLYFMNLFKERFERREKEVKRESIEEIITYIDPPRVIGAVFLQDLDKKDGRPKFVVALTVKGQFEGRKKMDILKDALNQILVKRKPLKEMNYGGQTIIYRDVKAEPGHGEKDLSAYVQLEKTLVAGSNPKILKSVIDVYNGKLTSIAKSGNLKDMMGRVKASDIFIYIDNSDMDFSSLLHKTEKEQGVTILMSVELLEAACLSLDLFDPNTINGTIIFKGKKNIVSLKDIEDDAIFLGKAIERAFVNDRVEWLSDVATKGNRYVVLAFNAFGFKPILGRAILRSKISVARQQPASEEVAKKRISLKLLIPKILFGCFVVLAIVVVVFIRKLKK